MVYSFFLFFFFLERSKLQFDQVYERLDVTCDLFGESEYNSMIPNVVEELT